MGAIVAPGKSSGDDFVASGTIGPAVTILEMTADYPRQHRKNQSMNRKALSSSVSAAVLSLSAVCATAAEPGFYVTASLGIGEEDPRSAGTNIGNPFGIVHVEPDDVDVDDGKTAWSVGLGYRVNRYLAAEVEYIDFGTTDITEHYSIEDDGAPVPFPFTFPTELTLNQSSSVTGPALSLLGALPLGENFELFLRGGALFGSREIETGFDTFDEKFSRTVWLAGAGVSWSLAKRWAIRAEYQQTGEFSESFIAGETEVQRLSMSVLFRL
jgi:opacity protein-like surface antigen